MLSVSNSTFANCTGGTGGAVYGTSSHISIAGCGFSTVKSTGVGGIVYLNSGSLSLANCTATNFRAEGAGGVLYTDSAAVVIDGLVAEDSTTVLGGGAIGGVIRDISGALSIRNSTFRNIMVNASVVYSGGTTWPLGDYLFGGVVGVGDATAPLELSAVTFVNCSGYYTYNVGGINAFGRVLYVGGNRTAAFSAVAIVGGTWVTSGVDPRGVVVLRSDVTGSFTGCTFDGLASNRGAVYLQSQRRVEVTGSTFSNCPAGGIFHDGSNQTLAIEDCRFSNCTGNGAIVVASAATNLEITDSSFLNNSRGTPSQGSAIYCPAPYSVFSSVFSGNASHALYMNTPNYIIMGNCAFCGPRPTEVFGVVIDKGNNEYNVDCTNDCDADGDPDEHEISAGHDTDCNVNGVPDSCEADSGGADCNGNGVPDSCDIAGGTPDCDFDGVPDSCESDCDSDGVPDSCEVAGGAPDCNTNGVPDSCEADCDGDGTLDVCEITSGAGDCDADGVPDSCQISAQPMLDLNNDTVLDTCQPSMQFAGLRLEIVPIVGRGTDDTFPVGAVCYRLFATTTTEATRVFAVYGNSANAMTVAATGGFWQSPYGADIATDVPCNLSAAPPTASYDSWFTIGLDCAFGNASQNANLNLTAFNRGGGVNDNDGAIYVVPDALQALAGSSKQVLLAQLTTAQAAFPSGYVNVIGRAANSTAEWIASHQQIPAPILVDCNGNGDHDAFDIALGTALDCDESGVPDSCEYPSAITDCNANGLSDLCDTVSGFSSDVNGNHVPDECECAGDVDGNGHTNVDDLLEILVAWGDGSYGPADLNQDGTVGSADLAIVLGGWGGCL